MATEHKTLDIKTDSRLTEMGIEITAHTPAANVTVELDLDYEPEYIYTLLQFFPKIIEDQMQKYVDEEETDAS